MSLKGLFTNNEENDAINGRIAELEKSVRKINTLDVHLKRFLQWERDVAPLLKKKEQAGPPKESVKEWQNRDEKELDKSIRQIVSRELQPFLDEIRRLNGLIDNLEEARSKKERYIPPRMKLARRIPEERSGEVTAALLLKLEQMGCLMEEMNAKLAEQNRRIIELEELERERKRADLKAEKQRAGIQPSPVIFQEYKIEKVIVDKYELNNTIGQLGIKELGGQLNIGATYGVNRPPLIGDGAALASEESSENVEQAREVEDG
ncbi:hypothetical protein [Bacillus sp. FJAT-27245]|uniref:hypothetical protein n=1 Tax=Bacillus sp. FJAT-27245 TaxID=1684144 RepID=UPI0006A7E5DE|nr:hypothetical protein [Bacillus sp. FJAT-27245]